MKELLSGLAQFQGLSEAALEGLVGLTRRVTIPAGTTLFHEGDLGEEAFVVVSGEVRIVKLLSLDAKRTLATLGPGAMFGEGAIVDVESRSAGAEAITDLDLLVFPAVPVQQWLLQHPEIGVMVLGRLGSILLQRLRSTNDLLRDTVSWSLEISGASKLGLAELLRARTRLRVQLSNGKEVQGHLVKVEGSPGGWDLWLNDLDERVHLIPYHAVVDIEGEVAVRGPVESAG